MEHSGTVELNGMPPVEFVHLWGCRNCVWWPGNVYFAPLPKHKTYVLFQPQIEQGELCVVFQYLQHTA